MSCAKESVQSSFCHLYPKASTVLGAVHDLKYPQETPEAGILYPTLQMWKPRLRGLSWPGRGRAGFGSLGLLGPKDCPLLPLVESGISLCHPQRATSHPGSHLQVITAHAHLPAFPLPPSLATCHKLKPPHKGALLWSLPQAQLRQHRDTSGGRAPATILPRAFHGLFLD